MIPRLRLVPGSTQKVCQLTGEYDRQRRQPAFNQTETECGLVGTDLGSSFEHDGVLWFLFGDTWPDPGLGDSVAWSEDAEPEPGVHLQFVTRGDGRFKSPSIDNGTTTGAFEVPIAGFSTGQEIYVFYSTGHYQENGQDLMGRLVLCRAVGDPANLHYLYEVSNGRAGGKFINVSPVIVRDSQIAGLPFEGDALLVWGSGRYRASDPYLACVPLAAVEDRSEWRYFTGREAGSGAVHWSSQEANALALFGHPQIGEFSVSWNEPLGLWLMLYNAGVPRGINFRAALTPWGAWTAEQVLFDPAWAGVGYGNFMHVSWDASGMGQVGTDQLYDPGRGADSGGEYGPYVISRYTTPLDGQSAAIYFTMSTWNTYNALLMTAQLERMADAADVRGSPTLIQSSFGAQHQNFEVVAPGADGGLIHLARTGDAWPPLWGNPQLAGSESGHVDAGALALESTSMIQSSLPNRENRLEVAAVTAQQVITCWRDPAPPWNWHGPYPVIACDDGGETRRALDGVAGNPVLIQSRYGAQGRNFELMVPDAGRGVRHYFRDNDRDAPEWRSAPTFGESMGRVDALTMIESTFGKPGNLEVIARTGDQLWFLWRDETLTWNGPDPLIADGHEVRGTAGVPSLIQGTYGAQQRNFELAVPLSGGGIGSLWRDNDALDPTGWVWHGPITVDQDGQYAAASLIQSSYGGSPGNLEVIARRDTALVHLWRDAQTKDWSAPLLLPWA